MIATSLTFSAQTYAADDSITGAILDFSSTPAGIIFSLTGGPPVNCRFTTRNMMIIKAEHKSMIATFFTMYAMGKKGATVYTKPFDYLATPGAYCEVTEYHPVE